MFHEVVDFLHSSPKHGGNGEEERELRCHLACELLLHAAHYGSHGARSARKHRCNALIKSNHESATIGQGGVRKGFYCGFVFGGKELIAEKHEYATNDEHHSYHGYTL